MKNNWRRILGVGFLWGALACAPRTQAEVMLQFFNMSWQEIADKVPEIAENGFGSLWLPPPQKASGDLSVGYDLWDPFDIGGNPQRTGGRTRYGTEEELLRLIDTAHRFGLRVYFDNIMNHRAFDIPGYNENTPIDIYPGMLPEDFHLQVTEDGFYRAWGDTANWGNTWQVQNQYLSGLIDIAQETPNANFGAAEGYTHEKISFVRHPNNPEYYDYHPTLGHVGFGSTNVTVDVIAANPDFYEEDLGSYMMRSIRWLVDYTKLDGLRLDAVKHVPAYFFGEQWAADKDSSASGYIGQAQWQFHQTRGFGETNYRECVFDVNKPRTSLMVFGEHMGEPPPYSDYFAAGMRLLDAKTHQTLNDLSWRDLGLLETSDYIQDIQFGKALGVYYAKSHDDAVAFNEHLHYAINLTREGLPNIYTDGNRQAETLGESGGAFPRHADTRPFGQFGDLRIPNLLGIHNSFARGGQYGRWSDDNVLAYERRDKSENWDMTDGDATTLMFMMNKNWDAGGYCEPDTAFPDGAILWQYAYGGGQFYTQVTDGKIKVTVPPAGYFAFSWRSPEESDLWRWGGGDPIEIYADGQKAGTMAYERWDGPDGDEEFNPYGLANRGYPDGTTPKPFNYLCTLPRATSATNLSFFAHVDGSAHNVLLKLNGGVPLNAATNSFGDPRDHAPGGDTTDVYLGYEQADFHSRIGPEKFAAVDSARNQIGSAGAEVYEFTVGSAGFTIWESEASNDWDSTYGAKFVYHDPASESIPGNAQFWPAPESAAGADIYFWAKAGNAGQANRVYIYYTTNGTWPEGAGGMGIGGTKVVELYWKTNVIDGSETNDWWAENKIPALSAGTQVKYKIGAVREQGYAGAPWDVPFPNSWTDLSRKLKMMGTWKIENFDPSAAVYRPHNDYGGETTGLVEGFNLIAARAFLQRDGAAEGNGQRASIFNTFYQPFYFDAAPPAGEVKYPTENETLYDNRYGAVVRTDPTVRRVWYNFVDDDASNDDSATGSANGNGNNASGQVAWVEAQRVNPSILIDSDYPLEWRFNYVNVPSSGSGTIRVKLAEYSSSTNPLLSDAAGHFTTLQRLVATRGPDYRMNVTWPQADGDAVSEGYVMKVEFSRALWEFTNEATVRSRFLILLDGVAQDRAAMTLSWRDSGNHELAFTLPDLYNDDPNYEHLIAVTHTNAGGGGITLYADRRVRVPTGSGGPSVVIVDPPEFDLNGDKYQIVLPDVASPAPEQRQHDVSVQTGPEARSVWISFTNSTGTAAPIAASTNALTGTVSVQSNSSAVVGSGTAFETEVSAGSVLQIGTNRMVVSVVASNNYLTLTRSYPGATASGLAVQRIVGNPTAVGNNLFWQFLWTNLQAGTYTLVANMDSDGNTNTVEGSYQRTTRVMLRQMVTNNPADADDDDDGLYDEFETESAALPESNPETWNNGDVHMWAIRGRTDPLMPDTDGDGLPDGLELGWGSPLADTDPATDTNGDGWKNFIGDADTPLYNTTDNWQHPQYNFNASRTDQLGGSLTDPSRADTDGDALEDNVEDLNRNGRVEVGLVSAANVVTNVLQGSALPTVYNTSRVDRDSLPANARFLETDPNGTDTSGNGMSDGVADSNANGRVDMLLLYPAGTTTVFNVASNPAVLLGMDAASQAALASAGITDVVSRALHTNALFAAYGRPRKVGGAWQNTNQWPRVLFLETDPLLRDVDQDGLDDGWEVRYGIDPFDDGWYNLRTGQLNATNSQQGADGDLTGDGVSNAQHQAAGTDPRIDVNVPVPPGSITVGEGGVVGQIGGVDVREEFMDWTWADLRALDYYQGDGPNSDQGDVFRGWDDHDESRDMVAFYTRDGGAVASGGDGKFYFRVDFYDLQAFAEDEYLDLYIAIDTGNAGQGERVMPDDVDTLTDMRWEVVAAVYDSAHGRVYVDGNVGQNTSTLSEDLFSYGGVAGREDYFLGAYFNAELDAVEFAIDRQALVDVGYVGDPAVLNFQVFTTKDGTCNTCGEEGGPGAGDIGGRSDVRDTIYNDWLAEDDYSAQAGLQGDNSVLRSWIRGDHRPHRANFSKIVHGNQAIQPGSVIQNLVNNDAGAGYYRVLDAHETLDVPLNLHVTPTLASAIQWAKADPAAGKPWRDGPALNARIATLAATGTVALMASTFSDHMLPYFTPQFVSNNVALASEFLETIYGVDITTNSVFWPPERLLDADAFGKIAGMGFRATVLDQMEHLFQWYGRSAALGTRGYQINRIDGVDAFAINNGANDFRFANHDGGLCMPLRRLFNRKARGDGDQVVVLLSSWEDFASKTMADAYDANLTWMANHPWIHGVTLESILKNEVDLDGDGWGNSWYVENRSSPGSDKLSHNYVNYMTRLDYDNWYNGSGLEEGLLNKTFESRPGVAMPNAYGMLYTGGVVSQAWNRVQGVTHASLSGLAQGVLHASVFETAFHSGGVGDMSKFSDGTYIVPDATNKTLAGFAAAAQAQSRMAAVYQRVQQWLAVAGSLTNAQTAAEDVDLDGENESLLYNRHAFAVFERLGGRMVAAWVRDAGTGEAFQTVGNFASYAGSETEWEGEGNTESNVVGAYRTSALKDWHAAGTASSYVNNLYSATTNGVAGGWKLTSADNKIAKTVTLGPTSAWFTVQYAVDASLGTLYVRSGLSPDLEGLLLHGQDYLGGEQHADGVMTLSNLDPARTVSALVAYGGTHNATCNTNAADGTDLDTLRMRNQAQTHQVELSGSGTFSFALGFEAGAGESYNDGVPYSWLSGYGYDPETVNVTTTMASNGVNNLKQAYVANLDPTDPAARFDVTHIGRTNTTFVVRFATRPEREYLVWFTTNGLVTPTWLQGPSNRIQGTGGIEEWVDPA
ncbi:MAG: alpha-amylase family glycosyl hydrolase, partial [Kiritimatiellia bacterium]